ncbi:GGDEF domain-containing phosphodiesterase [Neogemmobacter tilapiae]|uniref:Diguanylate cyclase n=1 Tax=Neogemmobacter tilapiae TaxID=875041 RepID=A0A918TVE9_9RHOB|nr:GGDEF domain-containing phosphodiesterase [Gemmobacter tilapiae]GHC63506.1 diguanylate cyclase [Gemmobacter tilapiae]
MVDGGEQRLLVLGRRALRGLRGPGTLMMVPAVALVAFWLGGETALLLVALGVPLVLALGWREMAPAGLVEPPLGTGGQVAMPAVLALLSRAMAEKGQTGQGSCCLVVRIDGFDRLLGLHGMGVLTEVLEQSAERLVAVLRLGDRVAILPDGGFLIGLRPERRIDLESMIQLSARLQAALTPAINIGTATHYVTGSVGFCLLDRAPALQAQALLQAALDAAQDASLNGPGAIRAFTPDVKARQQARSTLRQDLETALDLGQIRPHFQPQVSTDTGEVTGFEALARWYHPQRGILPPAQFLPMIEQMGLAERLGEVMLFHALQAISRWDRAARHITSVGVNFSAEELRNPQLAEKVRWELDRFALTPDRLSVEVLETVVAERENDIIIRNVRALADMGCRIDLDDFGTGHAAFSSVRRFPVRRIKIDRSFVTRVDREMEQQRMVAALVSMAEQLGLETLAEGVETGAEHAMLAQLGCAHVQGFGIARPMPFDETLPWMDSLRAAPVIAPRITRKVARR